LGFGAFESLPRALASATHDLDSPIGICAAAAAKGRGLGLGRSRNLAVVAAAAMEQPCRHMLFSFGESATYAAKLYAASTRSVDKLRGPSHTATLRLARLDTREQVASVVQAQAALGDQKKHGYSNCTLALGPLPVWLARRAA
jgi:hypothetical protein